MPYKSLSLADFFKEYQEILDSDKTQFLSLLENPISLDSIVLISFKNLFYASTGRTHIYPLNTMLQTLIIQRIFPIPTGSLLLVFLQYSKYHRKFCSFSKISKASRLPASSRTSCQTYN